MTPKVTLESIDAKIDTKIGGLSSTVNGLDRRLDDVTHNLDSLAAIVKNGFESMTHDIAGLKSDIERIDLHLGEAAHRFELVDLGQRVGRIEQQIGLSRT